MLPRRTLAATPIVAVTVALGVAASSAEAASLGALDSAFGGGAVQLPKGTQLTSGAVQPDGKLVVAGFIGSPDTPRVLVGRYTREGALDGSFGAGGLTTAPLPANATGARADAVAIQTDGKIVVAGDNRDDGGADGMLVTRFDSNGTPDGGFGDGGNVVVERGTSAQGEAGAIAIRPDGTIVVGGGAVGTKAGEVTATIAQFTPTGALAGSIRHLNIGESNIRSLVLQGDGRIVYAGTLKPNQEIVTILGRANADGTKDTSFAGEGVRKQNFSRNGAASSGFRGVALQPDGKIVATGFAFNGKGPGADKVTMRVDNAGNPDGSFGPDGTCYSPAAKSSTINTQLATGGGGVAIDGGHIYTGGGWDEGGASALLIAAQRADGTVDSAFGDNGQTITPIAAYSQSAAAAATVVGPDGVYVVGTAGNPKGVQATGVAARYGAYPLADTGGDTGGGGSGGGGSGGGGGGPAPGDPTLTTAVTETTTTPTTVTKPASKTSAKVSRASLSAKRISASSKAARSRRQTTLSYTLSAAGKVRLTVEQKLTGRHVSSKCVKATRASQKKKRCVYYTVLKGSKTLTGKKGTNTRTLTRKVTTTNLKPGTYRLVLQVLSGAKTTGARSTATLTVTK